MGELSELLFGTRQRHHESNNKSRPFGKPKTPSL